MKRLVSLLLSVLLVFSLAACASKQPEQKQTEQAEGSKLDEKVDTNLNETGFPIVKEKITLKMMGSKAPIQGAWEDLSFFKQMEKISNIAFTFDTPPAEVYAEKKNLAFASGDYPDLFFGGALTDTDEVKYGEGQKILIPLNGLIDKYAPNLKAYGVENSQMFPAITHSNGDIYTLPMVVPRASFFVLTSISWINQSWLNELGLSLPKTTDELYTVLKAFKDQDPTANHDMIPISGKTVLHGGILGAFGLLGTGMQVNEGVVQFNPMTDNYKEYLMYANKLYKEGILDNETFTQTDQQLSAKGAAMRLGMFSHAAPFVVVPMEHSLDYTGLTPLTSPVNNKSMTNEYFSVTRGTFAITTTNKYPEATMRWVDYLYCQDGARLAGTGVEGVDWEWKDKSKLTTTSLAPKDIGAEEYRGGHITPDCGTAIPRAEIASGPQEDPAVIDLLANAQKISEYGVVPYPQIYYSLEDADEISTLKVDIESYVSQMEARFITGEEPFTSWDTYVDKLEKLNVEKFIQIYQKNYDANKSSQTAK